MTALLFAPFCIFLYAATICAVTSAWWVERTSQSPTRDLTTKEAH